jgi:4-amino-4-deoxy-L-arabinose transferase-like glycosyltransferase
MKPKTVLNPRADRLSIGTLMLLIAGVALGLWLGTDRTDAQQRPHWLVLLVFVLGGLSVVGPPLLLLTAKRRPWGAGRFLWFVHGTAAWLLWPPVVYLRARGVSDIESSSAVCFLYGTPLMAVYVTLTLLAGGHLNRSRRRRIRRSRQETFGLLLGLAWACTGLYLISVFYREDLRR